MTEEITTRSFQGDSIEQSYKRRKRSQLEFGFSGYQSTFKLPAELRIEVYKHLAGGKSFQKSAMCHEEQRRSLQIPPILLASKVIREECSEEFRRHAPFFLPIPVQIWTSTFYHSRCPALDVALPKLRSHLDQNHTTLMPARRLCLQLNLGIVDQGWDIIAITLPNERIVSASWFQQLLQRLQDCPSLTELSIRWCYPWAPQEPLSEALRSIFLALIETVESMPGLKRYSIQIGSNAEAVSETPQWGLAVLSAYGRKGKGKQWEDESTVRHCSQEMPHGEWFDFLCSLQLYPMCSGKSV